MTQENVQPPSDAGAGDAGEKLVLTSPEQASSPKDFALWAGVILLAVLSAYSPALHGKFIWDDDRHVEQNRALRNAPGLLNIWAAHWRWLITGNTHVLTPQYYPMTHTTFWVEAQLSGFRLGQEETAVFHATNFVLHAAGAILLWFLLRELRVPGAWAAAAIFALHPVQVESVAWISERKNVLAGVFFFASILAYVKSGFGVRGSGFGKDKDADSSTRNPIPETRNPVSNPHLYALSLALFILAVLSKTVTCSMPAVVLLLIWWKRGRITGRDIARLTPFFAFGLCMALFTSHIERNWVNARGDDWMLSPAQRILIAGQAVWFYLGKLLWPAKLTFIYPRWDMTAAHALQWLAPIGVIAALGALFALRNRIGRAPFVAAAIYVGVLFPALGFFNFYPQRYSFVADHFQYLASAALIALIVAGLATAIQRLPEAVPYVAAGVLLITLTVLTFSRASVYSDPLRLWRDTVAKNPDAWMPRNNLGVALLHAAAALPTNAAPEEAKSLLDGAAKQFERAAELRRNNDRALANWGRVLLLQKQPADALLKLDAAVAINPKNVDALIDRARALTELNRPAEAKAAHEAALAAAESQPETPRAKVSAIHDALARLATKENRLADARKHYERSLELVPGDVAVRREFAKFLSDHNDLAGAAVQLQTVIKASPGYIEPHLDLAELRMKVGNVEGAHAEWRVAGMLANTNPGAVTPEVAQRMIALFERIRAATQPSTTRSTTTRATTAPATAP